MDIFGNLGLPFYSIFKFAKKNLVILDIKSFNKLVPLNLTFPKLVHKIEKKSFVY